MSTKFPLGEYPETEEEKFSSSINRDYSPKNIYGRMEPYYNKFIELGYTKDEAEVNAYDVYSAYGSNIKEGIASIVKHFGCVLKSPMAETETKEQLTFLRATDIESRIMFKDYKNRCADCACLVEVNGEWFCDESNESCSETEECPEGVAQCAWCEEYFTDTKLHREVSLGLLCDHCLSAIQSRGEKLTIEL